MREVSLLFPFTGWRPEFGRLRVCPPGELTVETYRGILKIEDNSVLKARLSMAFGRTFIIRRVR
jgi:hypothetical protein